MEEHAFIYSLYPHGGDWRQADVYAEALDLNDPLDVVHTDAHAGERAASASMLTVQPGTATLEALKLSEDGCGWIIRVVERHGVRSVVCIGLPAGCRGVAECNLMEEDVAPLEPSAGAIELPIMPYEIKTLKINLDA